MSKRLAWRCRDIQQQRDKAEIYNSKEWKQLRDAKLTLQPLCEMCLEEGRKRGIKRGYVRSATCVHHIVPIETATTKEEMWRLAIGCGLSGLMSLCRPCHNKIHNDAGYHTKEAVQERKQSAFERWKAKQQRFINNKTEDNGIQKEVHTGLIRKTCADRAGETQAQTDSDGNSNNSHEMG